MFGLVGLGSTGLGRDWLCWAKMGWFAGMDSAGAGTYRAGLGFTGLGLAGMS